MRVLVDSSVWIRFIAGRSPFAEALDKLLSQERVLAHRFVYGELLIGDRGGRTKLLESISHFRFAHAATNDEVEQLVRRRNLQGRGIGWIDAHLLASALVARAQLYTADRALSEVAAELGVGFPS